MMSQSDVLTRVNLDDLLGSFGCARGQVLAAFLDRLFRAPARLFADQIVAFDKTVGQSGDLVSAARMLLQAHYARGIDIVGRENIPVRGPALFLANHPGMTDTLGLIAAIGRTDLKIVAQRRPFLEALGHTAKHVFFVDENLGRRVIAAHDVAAHLRSGGAVLTFPAGHIEPDPAVASGAAQSLATWSDSSRFIARLAPATPVVPVLVRGVIWQRTARLWLTRLKRTDRERFAAALQLLAMVCFGIKPTAIAVNFAAPVSLQDGEIHQAVIGRMRGLIADAAAGGPARTPDWEGQPQPTLG